MDSFLYPIAFAGELPGVKNQQIGLKLSETEWGKSDFVGFLAEMGSSDPAIARTQKSAREFGHLKTPTASRTLH